MFHSALVFTALAVIAYGDPILLSNGNSLTNDIAPHKLDGRIVGGKNTSVELLPYQVSLHLQNRHYCGGSIISSRWVVTAAHCATKPTYWYTVRVGSNRTDEGGNLLRVSYIISHENYGDLKNDVALLRLELPITFDKNTRPISLVEDFEVTPSGAPAVVSGWGDLGNGTSPRALQSVVVPIVSKEDCTEAYGSLDEGQICAGNLQQGGKDSCQGDSGGPLTVHGRLAGIVSWGRGCAQPGYPGVYTEVSYFRPWIRRNSGV